MITARRFQHKNNRVLSTVLIAIVSIIAVVVIVVLVFPGRSSLSRVNFVVASSPVVVWSWDREAHTVTVVSLPANTDIDAVHGYGRYSLDALWRLGSIDPKAGALLSESVSDVLGLSNSFFIGDRSDTLPPAANPLLYGRKLFSLINLWRFLGIQYRTNIPLSLFISFSRELGGLHSDQLSYVDITQKIYRQEVDLPDGSKQYVLSPEQVDAAFAGVFEDDDIRKELLTVALDNTTQIPSLGNRAARLLAAVGVHVVSVGNDEPELHQCTVEGRERVLATKTARVIGEILNCQLHVAAGDAPTDLVVDIGTQFADRYKSP